MKYEVDWRKKCSLMILTIVIAIKITTIVDAKTANATIMNAMLANITIVLQLIKVLCQVVAMTIVVPVDITIMFVIPVVLLVIKLHQMIIPTLVVVLDHKALLDHKVLKV